MNTIGDRKRLVWLAVIGGVLLVSLLFVSLMAPSAHPGEDEPVIRPETVTAEGTSAANSSLAGTSGTGTTDTAEPQGFSLSGGDAFSLAWRLGLVAIIIAVSIAGLRWWGKRTSGPRSTTGFLRVLDTLAISNGRTIHLVALGERVIAVGATAQQLTFLNELTEDEAARVLAAIPEPSDQPIASFAAELFQQMRGTGTPRTNRLGRRDIAIGEERR
ncbi:MAG: FliO/MopB family protein [Hyphomicrobiales bacterium]